jgi:nucleoside-diphosphate-sugar epimerase
MSATREPCLVTGANGFVGSHVVERLVAQGERVRALVRATSDRRFLDGESVETAVGDVGDASAAGEERLARATEGCRAVYHVAGVVRARSQEEYDRVNAAGAARIARAAARAGVRRFVLVSSQAAAGPNTGAAPRDEAEPERPVTAYGRSKLAGERLVAEAARGGSLEVVVVRPPAVYGPRDRAFLMLFRLVSRGLLLLYPGADTQEVSLIHVRDLAAGLALAGERAPAGAIYYLTDGGRATSAALGDTIARALGKRPLRIVLPTGVGMAAAWASETFGRLSGRPVTLTRERLRQWSAPRWTVSDARARREIGYAPQVDLESGMSETALWYREAGWV